MMACVARSGYRSPMLALLVVACDGTPDDGTTSATPPGPVITEGPLVAPAPSPDVAFVRRLTVATDVPSLLTVVVDGAGTRREIGFPTEGTTHDVPLLGLVEQQSYTATVTVATAEGGTTTAEPVSFTAGEGFLPAPDRTLLSSDPARAEPGYTMYAAEAPSTGFVQLEVVDELGRLVWQYRPPLAAAIVAPQFHAEDGTVSALLGGRSIRRMDLADSVSSTWTPSAEALEGEIPVDVPGFHHEAVFEPDGTFWSLHKQDVPVNDYPLDPFDLSDTGPALLDADVVVHVAADGAVLGSWLLTDYLDPHRIGFDATDEVAGGAVAWSHANAIVPLCDGEQSFIVSSRHQDALVKIRGDANEAVWILANHDGWAPEYVPLLLDPVGPWSLWFIHQHAPALDATGQIVLFDNGNWSHGNPYQTAPPGDEVSRIMRYEIDEVLGTVTETFSFIGDEAIDPLFSQALGNADELPLTGNLLGTFAYLKQELGIPNFTSGLGAQSVRIIEVDPDDGSVVWDLRLNGPSDVSETGWQADRAIRIASLYAPDVTVRALDP